MAKRKIVFENIKSPDYDALDVVKAVKKELEEKKAVDIAALNLSKVNSYFDYFVICTANSKLHSRALVKDVTRIMAEKGAHIMSCSSLDSGWIVLDYSDIIVHIFNAEEREYYNLEKLWADADRI